MHPTLSPHSSAPHSSARAARALGTLAAVATLLAASSAAHAQSSDADRFRPQPPPARTPATGLRPGAATVPPPPPGAAGAPTLVLVTSPALPPVDRVYPRFVVGFTAGLGLRTPETFDSAVAAGPSWSAMGGVQINRWVEIDARYFGMYTARDVGAANDQRWLTHAGAGVVRLTAPTPFVRPFVFGGVGAYVTSFAPPSSNSFGDQGSVMHAVHAGLPVGGGLDVPVTGRFVMGAELVWHPLIGARGPLEGPTGAANMVTGALTFRFVL